METVINLFVHRFNDTTITEQRKGALDACSTTDLIV